MFVVVADKIDRPWLCSWNVVMSDHPSSPPIPSSSIDPNLLSPPTSIPIPPSVFYSQLTPNRPVTPPQNASISTSTPISNCRQPPSSRIYSSSTYGQLQFEVYEVVFPCNNDSFSDFNMMIPEAGGADYETRDIREHWATVPVIHNQTTDMWIIKHKLTI